MIKRDIIFFIICALNFSNISFCTGNDYSCTESMSSPNNLKRNISMVYVRRMRKAGSTSVYMGYKHAFPSIFVEGDEQARFNIPCLYHPSASRVLFVTHLREPISRIKSEFYYMGPGGKRAHYQPNIEPVWKDWIEDSHNKLYEVGGNHSGWIHGGTLIDNLLIRALSANCGKCVVNTKGHMNGCELCGRHGRLPRLQPVTNTDYDEANKVLEKFDIVIVVEYLKDESYVEMLALLSHAPTLSFGHARTDEKAHTTTSEIPQNIKAYLENENNLDISLYKQWNIKTSCALESFKNKLLDRKREAPQENYDSLHRL
jgi:hypothetical protein